MSRTHPELPIAKVSKKVSIALIVSRFNSDITHALLKGCERALTEHGMSAKRRPVYRVPGSVELPRAAAEAVIARKFDAIIVLGAIIKGETDAYEYDCRMTAQGVMDVNVKYQTPVIYGVLTCQNRKLALARCKSDKTNTGYYCGKAALMMIETLHKIRHDTE